MNKSRQWSVNCLLYDTRVRQMWLLLFGEGNFVIITAIPVSCSADFYLAIHHFRVIKHSDLSIELTQTLWCKRSEKMASCLTKPYRQSLKPQCLDFFTQLTFAPKKIVEFVSMNYWSNIKIFVNYYIILILWLYNALDKLLILIYIIFIIIRYLFIKITFLKVPLKGFLKLADFLLGCWTQQ